MRTKVRRLRHWKQRFNVNADFIFRRRIKYGPKTYEPGDLIPDILKEKPTKLRRFWESGTIELAEFEDPNVATGQVTPKVEKPAEDLPPLALPEGVTVESTGGSWFLVKTADGETKVNGQKALDRLLEELGKENDEDWLD